MKKNRPKISFFFKGEGTLELIPSRSYFQRFVKYNEEKHGSGLK